MQISVTIELFDPVREHQRPKPPWGSPGAELSTWTTFVKPLYTDTHCVTALHSYTTLYSAIHYTAIQLYSAIHSTTSTTPLCVYLKCYPTRAIQKSESRLGFKKGSKQSHAIRHLRRRASARSRCPFLGGLSAWPRSVPREAAEAELSLPRRSAARTWPAASVGGGRAAPRGGRGGGERNAAAGGRRRRGAWSPPAARRRGI